MVALVESAYRGSESRAGWTSEAELIEGQRTDAGAVAEIIASPAARVLLAEQGPVLQACCELRKPGWYARRGYRDTGERRPFPYGDKRAGRPKVDDP